MKDKMTKAQRLGSASFREFKAAALDTLVKREQESKRALLEPKMTRLKELRLARDAAEPANLAAENQGRSIEKVNASMTFQSVVRLE